MKWTIGLALFGALAFSASSWADGLSFEHNFNGATIVSNQSLNANGAVVFGSGNSANFNSSKSTSGSCAGICLNGNTISGVQHHQKGPSS